ncbi:NAD(P)H-binding protein [Streptomyces griseorubiginosus]|uniref:NAD(P)H-binding protein n=1 Tax=Streptomyces griseorubiginosus TaxID=67304 RepID=UPI001AD64D4F|nr:NAD(P)H-binding protein [Streptomyces griseorubiginosus]MBO4258778.1 NAD(P)H-binding protein [Streptomyces griseorubiginosus]
MILVTGATGTIGREVVRQLVAGGEKVRALTRDPQGARLPSGVEAVRGHHRDRASVEAAMTGADAAFLVGVFGPDDAGHDRGLVESARAAGVRRIVKLSGIGTGDPDVGPVGTWHVAGEQAVQDSGAEWTILRPSAFASNTLGWADAVRAGTPLPNTSGTGGQGVVDPRDVSAVAVAALVEEGHAGRTYTLTGPEVLSVPDQAAVLAELLGHPVEVRDLSTTEARAYLLGLGFTDTFIDASEISREFVRNGGNEVVTDDVRQVLGRPARTYREWAEDHKSAFSQRG